MTSTLNVADRRREILDRRDGIDRSVGAGRTPRTAPARTAPARTAPARTRRRVTHGVARREGQPRRPILRMPRITLRSGAKPGPPPGTFYAIAGIVVMFVLLGLVMVLSASAMTESNLGNSPYAVFSKQAMWAGIGLLGMICATQIPYTFWRQLAVPILVIGTAAMVVPLVPGLDSSGNGARSWIRLGPLSVQPSEFLKLAVVIAAAELLTRREREMARSRRTLVPIGVLAALAAGMCLGQGDLGSAIVLGTIVFGVAWIAGMPAFRLGALGLAGATIGVLFVVTNARRLSRFTAFMDIEGHKEFESYQVYQGMVSIANGGLSGSGIGGSRTKLGYLPYAHSDFIFSIIADELGILGAGAVILGFLLLVAFGVQASLAAPDRFGMLLAGGISVWFGVQAIINLGGVTGVMPVTGLTLPFFSAGGTSLFVSMFAAGLLLSVARRAVRS